MMLKAEELHSEGGWQIEGESIAPEDGVNPDDSTSTRSICRNSSSLDTNRREDWHITPARGATFGGRNGDDVYVKLD
jgi:hypothetical protein